MTPFTEALLCALSLLALVFITAHFVQLIDEMRKDE